MNTLTLPTLNLVGFSRKHTLDDDADHRITAPLKQRVLDIILELNIDTLYLVQIYDESDEIVTFVGIETETCFPQNSQRLKINADSYWTTTHLGSELTIDDSYKAFYSKLAEEGKNMTSNFDIERHVISNNELMILVPTSNQTIKTRDSR